MQQDTDFVLDNIEVVKRVFQKLKTNQKELRTITPQEYNHNREPSMPLAVTIMQKTQKSWSEILALLDITAPLTRNTKATLSNALHLLEKKIVHELNLGWEEIVFPVAENGRPQVVRRMRPDSCCTERLYLENHRLLIVDVKLSIYSAPITIYKYLPIFQEALKKRLYLSNQMTFFPQWLPEEANNSESLQQSNHDGQMDMFLSNDILYIAYLIGERRTDLLPGAEIRSFSGKKRKKFSAPDKNDKKHQKNWVKLPENMEVKFIPFQNLPQLYCQVAGIDYHTFYPKMEPILNIAKLIKEIVLTSPPNAHLLGNSLYSVVKTESSPVKILEMVNNT